MGNETAYLSYFWWKDYYEVTTDKNGTNPPLVEPSYCRLCEMLNNPDRPPKVYDNVNKWWTTDGHCRLKGSYPWSKYRSDIKNINHTQDFRNLTYVSLKGNNLSKPLHSESKKE